MSTVAVLGGGHVGLVHGAGLAELGHTVTIIDVDRDKIRRLRQGDIWFYEPGLRELMCRNVARDRLAFTSSYADGLAGAAFVFMCLPTPTGPNGDLDVRALRAALSRVRRRIRQPAPILVNKSTVPVGTADAARQILASHRVEVVANPEFLAEGRAVDDFFHPNRIVLGARDRLAAERVAFLYRGLSAPVVLTDPATAEFSKLASNAFLATKISVANVLARLAERVGADVNDLVRVLALDGRIGGHLYPGLGFGGSCFPKDVTAVEHLARTYATAPDLFSTVLRVNREQRRRVLEHLAERLDGLAGKRVAILGVAFKAGTDDIREAPAVALAKDLLAIGAQVVAYDPIARPALDSGGASAAVATSALEAVRDADAVIFATEWPEFAALDLQALRDAMRGNVIVDGRGVLRAEETRALGFDYFGFGRGGRPRPAELEVSRAGVRVASA